MKPRRQQSMPWTKRLSNSISTSSPQMALLSIYPSTPLDLTRCKGVPLVDLALEDFSAPITSWSQTVFLTSRGAARRMSRQGSGVILTVQPPAAGTAFASGFGAAVAAVQSVASTLAAEVGPQGVRVLILQPNALPQSQSLQE